MEEGARSGRQDDRVGSVGPKIYKSEQLRDFVEAPAKPPLSAEEAERIAGLVAANFGLEPEEPKFKGTMVPIEEFVSA